MEKNYRHKKSGWFGFMRFFRPSMRFYFAFLVVFLLCTLLLGHWELAAIEFVLTALLICYTRFYRNRQEQEVLDYVGSTVVQTEDGATNTILTMPMPLVIFNLKDGLVLWSNEAFLQITGDREHIFEVQLGDMVHDFSLKWLAEGHAQAPETAMIGDRKYRVYGSVYRLRHGLEDENHWGICYFVDVTDYEEIHTEYELSRPITAVLLLDNYDELIKNLNETAKSALLAQIDRRISEWCAPTKGYLCRYDRDRYIFIFEERFLKGFVDGQFSLLDSVRELQSPAGIAATLSIGVGRGAKTLDEGYQFSMLGIETALARGGDQAVVKTPLGFSFHGGTNMAKERRTKVKSRVMASTLEKLIGDASNLLIMGHKAADLDCLGAAAALCCIARKMGKPAKIIVDRDKNLVKQFIARLKKLPEYEETFMTPQEGLIYADGRTLLIVVDAHRPDRVESMELLQSCNKVAIIDHHRRAADYIADSALNFHEPFASSASEMTTELLQCLVETSDILKLEAEAILSGIVLDTKNFTMNTGSRSFEAAAFLRRCGADTTEVKKLFQNDLEKTVMKYSIIQRVQKYRPGIVIAECEEAQDRIIAAQAADELLNIADTEASFVMYAEDGKVIISARSIGQRVNVQRIMEALGGGGSSSNAGAQVPGRSCAEVAAELKRILDDYLKNESNLEGNNL